MSVLHVFDMDGTLLPGTTACLELARHLGCEGRLHDLEASFAAGGSTVDFARALLKLMPELTSEVVAEVFEAAPKLTGIREVLDDIAERGEHAVLITMSPDFFAQHFAPWGMEVFASVFPPPPFRRALAEDGILTPADKPRLCAALQQRHGVGEQVVAYGDSHSDLPLFRTARHAVAVNATAHLRAHATVDYVGGDLRVPYAEVRRILGRLPAAPVPPDRRAQGFHPAGPDRLGDSI
ncbi:hypothetical protein Stsp01_24580 [Streptomyces sp. NBRC 13847]|uniref:HAD family hydrolase n=1 Tax=Streptomyces TaxID=1883 RepID=UPI0024A4986F|nr:haloacid dehalogenase-like hydrolase [Streptomyces sp. NBRC 13847]GLW15715.1 hypothetical protein Stsp01_24580 [Streptomyces sp. NBRC 13847]